MIAQGTTQPAYDITWIKHDKRYPRPEAVPPSVGIYAWFIDFSILLESATDRNSFLENLRLLSAALSHPPLHATLSGIWKTEFQGQLEHVVSDAIPSSVLASTSSRMRLAQIVASFSPLTNPLYIGITAKRTLRKRYSEHIESYDHARATGTLDGKMLGSRLAEKGITPRFLLFGCIPLSTTVVTELQQAESLLNQLFRPILGRR